MDEFLRDIHTIIFRQWLLHQKSDHYKIYVHETKENMIVIETNYSYSEITFNRMNIIEFSVTNTTNDTIEFYLHFQMNTMKHAVELFKEMLESIKKLVDKPKIKVLLSCSGGLTTGFFAQKLNEAATLLFLNYEFYAAPYGELFNVGNQYDVILLAPQISYMHANVQEILNDKLVLKIPSQIFAKYDVGKAITLIQQEMNTFEDKKIVPSKPISLKTAMHNNMKVLVIAMLRTSERVHLAYRIYDEENVILLDTEIIKNRISLEDIYDILDTVLVQYEDIQLVGISLPGIINEGRLTLPREGFDNVNVLESLSQRYSQKFVLNNDVNCIAVGYYASQDTYSTLSFLFQPRAGFAGGVGSIYNGELIVGRKHIAGEVQYLPMRLSDDLLTLTKTPEGSLELVSQTIACIISILGPEVIVLSCHLLVDLEELKREITKYIPEEYIPDIVKVDYLQEYILFGQMILSVQKVHQEKQS